MLVICSVTDTLSTPILYGTTFDRMSGSFNYSQIIASIVGIGVLAARFIVSSEVLGLHKFLSPRWFEPSTSCMSDKRCTTSNWITIYCCRETGFYVCHTMWCVYRHGDFCFKSHPWRLGNVQLIPYPRGLQQNKRQEWESNHCTSASTGSKVKLTSPRLPYLTLQHNQVILCLPFINAINDNLTDNKTHVPHIN